MCVDYTDFNAACPKDPYPLPSIDQLIDAISRHVMFSFMDAFSGYNRIKMNPKDIAKTAFITHRAVYAYKYMPFGLMNVESTYQRAMVEVFKDQLGKNLESYVDDIIAKSKTVEEHVPDLKECFENLRKHRMKLNPEKCTFGVGAGKFLEFMISYRRIEANPEKIRAILEMEPPRTQKDIQKLAGSLVALRRFIPKLGEHCLPFFNLLEGAKNKKEIAWGPECQEAFEAIKEYLSSPPVLTKAEPGEPLYLYLSAGPLAIWAALIWEHEGQLKPVYYVSQVLKEIETRYPNIEKFAFALVMASRKLRHYFQGREIKVITDQPLRRIIPKPDVSGRLVNWVVEHSQFQLTFIPRTTIKAQSLVDFIVECTFSEPQLSSMMIDSESGKAIDPDIWTLYVDGSSTSERSGAGIIMKSPDGFRIK